MVKCYFSDVSERDMDLLFLEEFVCSEAFLQIFTDKVGIANPKVLSVHSSKIDVQYGESDMTVIIESNGERIGLLIEDKIDAIAMPRQSERYNLRGQKGINLGDYNKFFVFIIAPKKYLEQNKEAKKYPNQIEYETVLSYFENLNDFRCAFKIQQIKQAIDKQKKGYQVEEDPAVTEFWSKYSEYQKVHYPDIDFIYNNEIKGTKASWPRFRTVIDSLYINHKTERGFVDLTFDNCATKLVEVEQLLADTIGDFVKEGFTVHKTNKSAAVRLSVPIVDVHKPLDEQIDEVETGLSAVKKISDLVRLFSYENIIELLNK